MQAGVKGAGEEKGGGHRYDGGLFPAYLARHFFVRAFVSCGDGGGDGTRAVAAGMGGSGGGSTDGRRRRSAWRRLVRAAATVVA